MAASTSTMTSSSIYMLFSNLRIECTRLENCNDDISFIDLSKYDISLEDADTFFRILTLLPLLRGDTIDTEQRCAIFQFIAKNIYTKIKTLKAFSVDLGCNIMSEFLVKYF